MRIVHVITRLIVGGAQENTLYTVEDLVERHGDDVILLTGPTTGPEGNLLDRAKQNSLNVRIIDSLQRAVNPAADWRAYHQVRAELARIKPDVVHTHSSKAGIVGRAAAFRLGMPAIVHTIHGLPFHPYEKWWRNRLYVAAERWAARRCHKIITVANAMAEQAAAAGVAPKEKFVTIYSGMEVEPFLSSEGQRDSIRQELGLAGEHFVVGKFARLFEHKGHDDVIEAARLLTPRFANLRFLFVGDGVWSERLRQRIDSLGLKKHFVFTGLVPPAKIPPLLSAVDLVVHASYREGLARVLPQALISGKAVVSYDIDGAREVVLPGETGILVKPGDVAGLAAGIEQLLEDSQRRRAFGMRGRELFTDRFRHEHMTAKIRAMYEAILHGQEGE